MFIHFVCFGAYARRNEQGLEKRVKKLDVLVSYKNIKDKEMNKENNTVYTKTTKRLSYLAATSLFILLLSYFYGWTFIISFILFLIALIIITAASVAFGFCFFVNNKDIDNYEVTYSRKQKVLIGILSIIPTLILATILISSHYGNIERDEICNIKGTIYYSKEYVYPDICSQTLKDFYVVFKYNDSQVANALKEVKASANQLIAEKTKKRQWEKSIDEQDRIRRLEREAEKQKEEQEQKTLNININVHINIPGSDVIEQKILLKIDPNSTKDIDVNVTKS